MVDSDKSIKQNENDMENRMKYLACSFVLIGSMASAEVLRGVDAKTLLGNSKILESSIEIIPENGSNLTDDNFLILGKRTVLSLVQSNNSIYLCDHVWEKVTGGNLGSEPYWRQVEIVCSN